MQFKTKRKSREKLKELIGNIIYTMLQFLALIFVLILVNQCVFGVVQVHGESMEPTLREGEYLFCIKIKAFYRPQRGDVVLARTGKGYENELVKRIIGMPGDEIDIDDATGLVFVNGEALEETYLKEATFPKGDVAYPFTVPPNQYFVLGDNRKVSLDSRYSEIGTVEKGKIDGLVVWKIYPFQKIGRII